MRRRVLELAGGPVEIAVRRSSRARRLILEVHARGGVELVVPRGVAQDDADRFLHSRRGWLERQLAWRGELDLDRPGVAWLGGEPVPLAELRLRRQPGALERFYRREARACVEAALDGYAYDRIAIRDQRTRWGSCSPSGTLSFSWRLVVAPPDVLDYVVVHELCHLREPNHGPRFWRLVEELRPCWRDPARWLRRHGRELASYDPEATWTTWYAASAPCAVPKRALTA
jgi:predicted metal-dependent hydrolase